MKLLFLDIDGVLNDHTKRASGYCGIQLDKVDILNKLLDAVPDVQIVISSAWRYLIHNGAMTLKGFEYMLLVNGLKVKDRLHGITTIDDIKTFENEPSHFDLETWKELGLKWRAQQIRAYNQYFRPNKFIVLDDLSLKVDNLVQTDGEVGLTGYDVIRAIAILK